MKKTLSTSEAADRLKADEFANWSYNGAHALIEYLEQLEKDMGEDIEFDRVAIRCDYDEYKTALEAAENYSFECQKEAEETAEEYKDRAEEEALEYLKGHTEVLEFDGGIIIRAY